MQNLLKMGKVTKAWKEGAGASACASCGRKNTPSIVSKGAKVIKRQVESPPKFEPEDISHGYAQLDGQYSNSILGAVDPETGLLDIAPIDYEIPFGVVTLQDAEKEDLEPIEPPKKGRRKTRKDDKD